MNIQTATTMNFSTPIRRKNKSRGSQSQFPGKLHDMMTYVENNGLESTISWTQKGNGVIVHNPEKLLDILAIFFGQSRYRSFQRQLNGWHFERVLTGPEKGAFVHPYFVRGNKPLCAYMSRNMPAKPSADDTAMESKLTLCSNQRVTRDSFPEKLSLTSKKTACHQLKENKNCISTLETPSEVKSFIDGDQLFFAGRQFFFLDLAKHSSPKKLEKRRISVEDSKVPASKASLEALLEPISSTAIDSIFSIEPEMAEVMEFPRSVTPILV